VVVIMMMVTVGGIVFGQAQIAKANDVNGTVANVTNAQVTVGDNTLVIDSNTKIIGDLVPGASINIKATVQADGTLLATLIHVMNNNGNMQNMNSENGTMDMQDMPGNSNMQNNNHQKYGQMHQDNGMHLGNMNRQNQQ